MPGRALADGWSVRLWKSLKKEQTQPEQCDNCHFYRGQSCRRHAPITLLGEEPHAFPEPRWPNTRFNDWCGDWQAKGESA